MQEYQIYDIAIHKHATLVLFIYFLLLLFLMALH